MATAIADAESGDPRSRAPAPATELLVVVVNFRTPERSLRCLESLAPEADALPRLRVVTVENGSGDGSADAIVQGLRAKGLERFVTLVQSERNLGFAGGCNLGIARFPEAEFVLLLNSDTLVARGALAHCLGVMRAEPSIGALSCLVALPDGRVQNVARRFPTPAREVARAFGLPWRLPRLFAWADLEDPGWDRRRERRDVDWLGGAFLLLRGDLLRRIGALDERFFFYGEDVELCHRIARAGYRRHYDPRVAIEHAAAGSSDPSRLDPHRRRALRWRARYLVQRLCYGPAAEWLVRGCDLVVCATRLLLFAISGRRERAHEERVDLAILLGRA